MMNTEKPSEKSGGKSERNLFLFFESNPFFFFFDYVGFLRTLSPLYTVYSTVSSF